MASAEWAQLVCLTNINDDPVPIVKDTCYIGRTNGCDICHAGNKLISGKHCYISRDKEGKVWLYDTSTNGTLLNLKTKLTKGECRELHHGDEFHLVHKKDLPDEDVGYMFQDIKSLEAETSSDLDSTQDYDYADPNATLQDEDVNTVSPYSNERKRKAPEETNLLLGKKMKGDDLEETSEGDEKKSNSETVAVPEKSIKIDHTDSATKLSPPISLSTSVTPASTSVPSTLKTVKEPEEDAIAETLVCIICQEILHDCISLQPCMHSFCAGCYSEWMERSRECPSCRVNVERINKNHIVNNLVEAYFKINPDKKRPEEEIQALEAKNKITRDMLYPENPRPSSVVPLFVEELSETDENDSDESHSNSDEDDDTVDVDNPAPFAFNIFAGTPAPWIACRQCPNYQPLNDNFAMQPLRLPIGTAGPSSGHPDVKTFPQAPFYICQPRGDHLMCVCCLQRMPDRRREYLNAAVNNLPPQQCGLCNRFFCHAYWGCRRPDCNGCLGKFEDINFGKACLNFLILENGYESEIFKNYVETKGLSVNDILGECLTKMASGEYACRDQTRLNTLAGTQTPICYTCGVRNFGDLAYCLRRNIPKEELPKEVTTRPDCHWGKNCRTQKNKPEHARRYNHICEQTRLT